MKNTILAVALLLVLGGGYYAYSQGLLSSAAPQQNTAANTNAVQNTNDTNTEPTISWAFEDVGERDFIPYTKVSVTVNGTMHTVGEFQGNCTELGATGGVDGKGLLAGELSAVQCWFAGGGDEIGVFAVEDGTLELMVGTLEEPIEGSAGFRGGFEIKPEFKL